MNSWLKKELNLWKHVCSVPKIEAIQKPENPPTSGGSYDKNVGKMFQFHGAGCFEGTTFIMVIDHLLHPGMILQVLY